MRVGTGATVLVAASGLFRSVSHQSPSSIASFVASVHWCRTRTSCQRGSSSMDVHLSLLLSLFVHFVIDFVVKAFRRRLVPQQRKRAQNFWSSMIFVAAILVVASTAVLV